MKPIRYIDLIDGRYQSKGYPPYDWSEYSDAPLTPLRKPLSECTVSLLTSGGISHKSREPFNPIAKNDFRLDEIDPQAKGDEFVLNDDYYDTRDGEKDLNVIFPLERLGELAAEGHIGKVADRLWSGFMGRIYKRGHVIEEAAPRLAEKLREDGVDIFVLVPA